jgi:hypothetical protein
MEELILDAIKNNDVTKLLHTINVLPIDVNRYRHRVPCGIQIPKEIETDALYCKNRLLWQSLAGSLACCF